MPSTKAASLASPSNKGRRTTTLTLGRQPCQRFPPACPAHHSPLGPCPGPFWPDLQPPFSTLASELLSMATPQSPETSTCRPDSQPHPPPRHPPSLPQRQYHPPTHTRNPDLIPDAARPFGHESVHHQDVQAYLLGQPSNPLASLFPPPQVQSAVILPWDNLKAS